MLGPERGLVLQAWCADPGVEAPTMASVTSGRRKDPGRAAHDPASAQPAPTNKQQRGANAPHRRAQGDPGPHRPFTRACAWRRRA